MTDLLNLKNLFLNNTITSSLWFKIVRRTAISLGGLVLVSSVGGAGWLWFFVNYELGSLVEKELTKLIDRPVKIGPIEQFYLTGLRVGSSAIPATATDPDFVEIPRLNVGFDPLMLIFERTLNLKISLIKPNFYIEQEPEGSFFEFNLNQSQHLSKTLNINIKSVKIKNGQMILLPNRGKESHSLQLHKPIHLNYFILKKIRAKAEFFQNDRLESQYEFKAKTNRNGYLKIKGQSNLSTFDTELYIQGDSLAASQVIPFIPNLPVSLESGKLKFKLNLSLQKNAVLSWQGNARFEKVKGQLANLPQPISEASGKMKFSDLRISLEKTQGFYGELPLKVNGTIDTTSDYNLAIRIPALSLEKYLKTLKLTLPVPIGGTVRSELKISGPLSTPILSGLVVSNHPTTVDLIDFVAAKFRFRLEEKNLSFTDIEAQPLLGGIIYGRGGIELKEIPELKFYLLAENLPADEIAALYIPQKLPINIGQMNGSATVLGQVDKPTAIIKWRSPDTIYPGSGEVTITKETTFFKNTMFQVGKGIVSVTGSIFPEKDRWQAFFNAKNLELNQLVASTTPPPGNSAIVGGGLRLSGTLTSLTPADIHGLGELELTTPDATVTGRGTLEKGQWRASFGVETLPGKALRLYELVPDLLFPMELGSGTLELSGTVDSFDRKQFMSEDLSVNEQQDD